MDLDVQILVKILYSLGIGILIGLERSLIPLFTLSTRRNESPSGSGSSEQAQPHMPDTLLGVRTFAVLSLGGFTAALIGEIHAWAAAVILSGLIIFVVLRYLNDQERDPGITTEISAVVCCTLGMLCYYHPQVAVILALIVTILLALKPKMPKLLVQLKRIEFTDTLKFLVIILIVLPLIPNRTFGPYDVFNPYKTAFLVILISGISFVGYFFTKFLGAQRGLSITGFFGGLTSSTAVTVAMASQAKAAKALLMPCAFATVIANATMFARVLVIVVILDRSMTMHLIWPIGTMLLGAFMAAIWLWKRSTYAAISDTTDADSGLVLKNPFSLWPAVKFGVFFVVILFVAKIAQIYLGDRGLYLASLVSGLADVDPITLSIAEQTRSATLDRSVGAIGITLAVVANSFVKSGIAVYSGGWQFGKRVGAILLGVTIAGLLVLLVF